MSFLSLFRGFLLNSIESDFHTHLHPFIWLSPYGKLDCSSSSCLDFEIISHGTYLCVPIAPGGREVFRISTCCPIFHFRYKRSDNLTDEAFLKESHEHLQSGGSHPSFFIFLAFSRFGAHQSFPDLATHYRVISYSSGRTVT